MLKLTGGIFKGRILTSPKNKTVRPTPSMVRAAIFDILNNHEYGEVLDLFAGTGAIGFEAIGRGANHVYFVDKSSASISIIKKNIEALGIDAQASVFNMDAKKALVFFKRKKFKFSLIFIDPPYKNVVLRDFAIEKASSLLENNGYVLVEYSTEYPAPPDAIANLTKIKTKRWGKTLINFYTINTEV